MRSRRGPRLGKSAASKNKKMAATLSVTQIQIYLAGREVDLLDPGNRISVDFSTEFKNQLPATGGVYAFFHNNTVFYVGETTCLRQRLAIHMRNPENHVLALKIARELHDRLNGKGTAGKTKKFSEDHKKRMRNWVKKNLALAFVALPIGRKELEERLCKNHVPEFNKRYPTLP